MVQRINQLASTALHSEGYFLLVIDELLELMADRAGSHICRELISAKGTEKMEKTRGDRRSSELSHGGWRVGGRSSSDPAGRSALLERCCRWSVDGGRGRRGIEGDGTAAVEEEPC